ncbi:MAG: hypothetical protein OSJ73_21130 [Lachnospiraceae bacterium]|nr:hypothetical protein [Lachnospiraceae bacterium]
MACIIREIAKSRCVSYFSTVPYVIVDEDVQGNMEIEDVEGIEDIDDFEVIQAD